MQDIASTSQLLSEIIKAARLGNGGAPEQRVQKLLDELPEADRERLHAEVESRTGTPIASDQLAQVIVEGSGMPVPGSNARLGYRKRS